MLQLPPDRRKSSALFRRLARCGAHFGVVLVREGRHVPSRDREGAEFYDTDQGDHQVEVATSAATRVQGRPTSGSTSASRPIRGRTCCAAISPSMASCWIPKPERYWISSVGGPISMRSSFGLSAIRVAVPRGPPAAAARGPFRCAAGVRDRAGDVRGDSRTGAGHQDRIGRASRDEMPGSSRKAARGGASKCWILPACSRRSCPRWRR